MRSDLIEPVPMRRAKVDGRSIFHWLLQTTIGDIHIVQHEKSDMELIDDYIGWSNDKADAVFERTLYRIIKGKA